MIKEEKEYDSLLDEIINLKNKSEALAGRVRSLEVLNDDLKSENKTMKSNILIQEEQISSINRVMKTKNDVLEAKDAMIEALKSQIKTLKGHT